ncbi:cobaltochelatase subunit CobN [Nakamurella leprariae]|uniref:Cobaltochelatase subunit CobN n=1 Tax=Nakamurella leprariae TaxID=2803911 RepID=A0A938YGV8_9ACTN|nr:cobaltochelatase subunit CobN [Nakamurella leprariae]MBM9468142.1 cobaltochelatase subunit CobN [Nakamurella leprariae]
MTSSTAPAPGTDTDPGLGPLVVLLSTSDTDLLSARAATDPGTATGARSDAAAAVRYRWANPSRLDVAERLPVVLAGADLVVVRILGTPQSWADGLAAVRAAGVPVVVLGGERTPDAELMRQSTVPSGVAAQAHRYLAEGGPENLRQLHRFLCDTVLLTGEGFDEPAVLPDWGVLDRPAPVLPADGAVRPRVGVIFYRAHFSSGNTAFVHALADAVDDAGGIGSPIWCTSLRNMSDELIAELRTMDALVVTVLAAGGTRPATAGAGGDDEAWDVTALAELDIPILQGLCLTWSRQQWAEGDEGLSPLDVATQVAVPEFDGRIITVPFSFKETDSDESAALDADLADVLAEAALPRYVADPERCARVAGIAVNHARLRHTPPADRRIALMLSAYPTKHARIGNAVGLDTPVSAIRLLRAMHEAGYDVGGLGAQAQLPGLGVLDPVDGEDPDTTAGNALIHALIAAGGQDEEWLTSGQLAGNPVRVPAATYRCWLDDLSDDLVDAMTETWGTAPGQLFVDTSRVGTPGADPDGDIVLATLRAGNVVVIIQPPRGFGENPVAIYHDPDMPPSHHYLAAYRWLEQEFGAHAVVHLGKHGNLEWLPGKNVGLSGSCGTDAALGNLPLIYPFLINDPGEGSQAKRRAHATIVDHLIPPMARAESYGDIARLEQLLDEHATVAAMDPAKLPAVRAQIWTLVQAARMDHDLGLSESGRPEDSVFDDFLLHVDGWLCEIKDVQIRDGLHVLGQAPTGTPRVNLVLAMLRATQIWGGTVAALPGLRAALGLKDGAELAAVDAVETRARALVQGMEDAGWAPGAVDTVVAAELGQADPAVAAVLRFAAEEVVPRLAGTTDELTAVLHALDGGFVPAGPSGSPLRGLINVLPTGRNFYSVDPKAIPSRLAFDTGQAMAESLVQRYLDDTGEYPRSVGLSVWGTSAMRTAGDDIGEVLALLGVVPTWDEASRRINGLAAIPLAELGRPRIDVTVRISGFFRDAFPHVVELLDDAVRLVAGLDEPADQNYVRAHAQADLAEHGDDRRATTRIFGSAPGAYGAGLLPLLESGNWRTDADLAEVYTAWGGFAYGRELDGVPARGDMEANYRRIAVAAKNTDTREHDIIDSDDYFQYHGGMVATVRALTGSAPQAYIGDSTTPDSVRTRSLTEETARVFRARVVNPRWIAAMQRHGYKGAFELAATVDYLFGYDATAGVVTDWMYDTVARTYALDESNQAFLRHANPWALRGIVERLHEAVERGLWAEPDQAVLDQLAQVYLDVEGDLEADDE